MHSTAIFSDLARDVSLAERDSIHRDADMHRDWVTISNTPPRIKLHTRRPEEIVTLCTAEYAMSKYGFNYRMSYAGRIVD